MTVTVAFFAFATTVLCMFVLRPVAMEIGLVDIPGGRKRHGIKVPLIGGIAMSLAIGLASSFLSSPTFLIPTLLAIYLLVAVGTVDDRYDLPAGVRLVAHAVAAMLIAFGGEIQIQSLGQAFVVTTELGSFAGLFTLLFIITLINAFNVIDGIDGLAGGLALICLGSLSVIGYGTLSFEFILIVAGATAGFLVFNFPTRVNRSLRSFMGDAGSTFLGLVVATLGISLSQNPSSAMPPVVGLWIVAVPVYDLFSAAIRRVLQGRSPFAPDHEHLHHALTEEGMDVRTVLFLMLSVAVLFAAIGLAGHFLGAHDGILLAGWVSGLVLYYQAMRRPRKVVRAVRAIRAMSGIRSALR